MVVALLHSMAAPSEMDGSRRWTLHVAGWGAARRKLERVWREAEQAGERRIATVAGRYVVDPMPWAVDAMKVVAVVSGENIREWKNGRYLLGPIDTQA
jgi:hypothetical protein